MADVVQAILQIIGLAAVIGALLYGASRLWIIADDYRAIRSNAARVDDCLADIYGKLKQLEAELASIETTIGKTNG